ncbi:hypothetical protein BB561_005442 [Smittium simulii]|uniref:Uncharacterized protein n=1 Tax=Smittium simulii TaxID=133385 RepID=A0A2T9YAB4_9FUNG|nr:hypothetical protein BB561_005442 [Smittium simulii]
MPSDTAEESNTESRIAILSVDQNLDVFSDNIILPTQIAPELSTDVRLPQSPTIPPIDIIPELQVSKQLSAHMSIQNSLTNISQNTLLEQSRVDTTLKADESSYKTTQNSASPIIKNFTLEEKDRIEPERLSLLTNLEVSVDLNNIPKVISTPDSSLDIGPDSQDLPLNLKRQLNIENSLTSNTNLNQPKKRLGRPRKILKTTNDKLEDIGDIPLAAGLNNNLKQFFSETTLKASKDSSYNSESLEYSSGYNTKSYKNSKKLSQETPVVKKKRGRPRKSDTLSISKTSPKSIKIKFKNRTTPASSSINSPLTDSPLTSLSESDFTRSIEHTPSTRSISKCSGLNSDSSSLLSKKSINKALPDHDLIFANGSYADNENLETSLMPVKRGRGRPRKITSLDNNLESITKTKVYLESTPAKSTSISLKIFSKSNSNQKTYYSKIKSEKKLLEKSMSSTTPVLSTAASKNITLSDKSKTLVTTSNSTSQNPELTSNKITPSIKRPVGRPRKTPLPLNQNNKLHPKSLAEFFNDSDKATEPKRPIDGDLQDLLHENPQTNNISDEPVDDVHLTSQDIIESSFSGDCLDAKINTNKLFNYSKDSTDSSEKLSKPSNLAQYVSIHNSPKDIDINKDSLLPGNTETDHLATENAYISNLHIKNDLAGTDDSIVKKKRPVGRPRKSENQISSLDRGIDFSKSIFDKRTLRKVRKTANSALSYSSDASENVLDKERGNSYKDSLKEADEITSIIKTKKKNGGKSIDLQSLYTLEAKNNFNSSNTRISEDLEYFTGIKRDNIQHYSSTNSIKKTQTTLSKSFLSVNDNDTTSQDKPLGITESKTNQFIKIGRLNKYNLGEPDINLTNILDSNKTRAHKHTSLSNEIIKFSLDSNQKSDSSDTSVVVDLSGDSDSDYHQLTNYKKNHTYRNLAKKPLRGRKKRIAPVSQRITQTTNIVSSDSLPDLTFKTLDNRVINTKYLHEFEAHNVLPPLDLRMHRYIGASYIHIPKYNRCVYGDVPLMRVASSDTSWQTMNSVCSFLSNSNIEENNTKYQHDSQCAIAQFFDWVALKPKLIELFYQKDNEVLKINILHGKEKDGNISCDPQKILNQTKINPQILNATPFSIISNSFHNLGQLEHTVDGSKTQIANAGINIMTLDWAPQTINEISFLAVGGIKKNTGNHYSLNDSYIKSDEMPSNNIIQIWEHNSTNKALKCKLFICHNRGPVWQLSWCPLRPADNMEDYVFFKNTLDFTNNPHTKKHKKLGRPSLISKLPNVPKSDSDVSSLDIDEFDVYDSKKYRHIGILAAVFGDGSAGIFSVPRPDSIIPESTETEENSKTQSSNPPAGITLPKLILDIRLPGSSVNKLTWVGCDRVMVCGNDGTIAIWSVSDAIDAKIRRITNKNNQKPTESPKSLEASSNNSDELDINLMPVVSFQSNNFFAVSADVFPPNISSIISTEQKSILINNKSREQIEASKSQVKGIVAHLPLKNLVFSIGGHTSSLTIDSLSTLTVNSMMVSKSNFWRSPLIWSSNGLVYLFNDSDWVIKGVSTANSTFIRNLYNMIGRELIQVKKLQSLKVDDHYNKNLKSLFLESEEIIHEPNEVESYISNLESLQYDNISHQQKSENATKLYRKKKNSSSAFMESGKVSIEYIREIFKDLKNVPYSLLNLIDIMNEHTIDTFNKKNAEINANLPTSSLNKSSSKIFKEVPWGKDDLTLDQLDPETAKMLALVKRDYFYQEKPLIGESLVDFNNHTNQPGVIYHSSHIWALAKSPVHRVVASVSSDGGLFLLNLPIEGIRSSLKKDFYAQVFCRLKYNPEDKIFEFSEEKSILKQNHNKRDLRPAQHPLSGIQTVAWHPSMGHSAYLAIGTAAGILRVDKVD